MAAKKGNTYWRLAKGFAVGTEKKYTPEDLLTKAIEYFEWVEKTPLKEQKAFGNGTIVNLNKMRAMTIKGFCLHANISPNTFESYCKDEAYLRITSYIKDVIYTQKFEGAAAGLLETNIIAREIGLKEKVETENQTTIRASFSISRMDTDKTDFASSEDEVK